MKKRLTRLLLYGGVSYFGLLIVLMLLETTLMYPAPRRREGDWNPTWLEHEVASFSSADGTELHGWFCEHPQPKAVILLCHGNGEHVAFMAEELEFIRDRFRSSVLAFDYRGYGHSGGRPYEPGILADGEAAQAWLAQRANIPKNKLVLWGRSLGGAVAVHLAAKNGAAGLVLDRTFHSMVDLAANHFPWLPVRSLLKNRYPSKERIQSYRGPLLQIHGEPDEVVPIQFGRELFEASPSARKRFLHSDSLTHNMPWPDVFYDEVQAFVAQCMRSEGER